MKGYKKFRSSGPFGGERFRGRKQLTSSNDSKKSPESILDEIVRRIRTRAEKFEAKSDRLRMFGKSSEMMKIAKELRECATSIRLGSWDDIDEI